MNGLQHSCCWGRYSSLKPPEECHSYFYRHCLTLIGTAQQNLLTALRGFSSPQPEVFHIPLTNQFQRPTQHVISVSILCRCCFPHSCNQIPDRNGKRSLFSTEAHRTQQEAGYLEFQLWQEEPLVRHGPLSDQGAQSSDRKLA